jgi:hypothetical protein
MSPARQLPFADSNGSSRGDSECGGTERMGSPVALDFGSLKSSLKLEPKVPPIGRSQMPSGASLRKNRREIQGGGG